MIAMLNKVLKTYIVC